jgi:MoCo/4Fe-4S cofactor protein with predicted Tat translocation signal
MANNRRYWKSLDDLNNTPEFIRKSQSEFQEEIPMDAFLENRSQDTKGTPRRDFLKFLGFSVTAATLAACETPVNRAVPYLVKPEEITLGISNWYASSFDDGHDYCSVLVKTREGRPIKIEGNKFSSFSSGATNARVQASVLSLYDNARLAGPLKNGNPSAWKDVDADIIAKLDALAKSGGNISILTGTITSPTLNKAIAEFVLKYPGAKVVTYDGISSSAIRVAHQNTIGKAIIPAMDFSKAEVIVSFGADFLGNWIAPIQFSKQYGQNRKVSKAKQTMSRHYQFESILSLTGSNADYRVGIKPSQTGIAVLNLYNAIAQKSGASALSSKATSFDKTIIKAADDLLNAKGKSLVVSGSNDPSVQEVVVAINNLLGNYGTTLDTANPLNLRQGMDAEVISLVKDLNDGKVGALIVHNCNPAYSLPTSLGFAAAVKKAGLSVAVSDRKDETAQLCQYVCPAHHYLESWGDCSPQLGVYSIQQPVIRPLFDTRQFGDTILKWSGSTVSYYDYLKANWQTNMFPAQSGEASFDSFWTKTLHDGNYSVAPKAIETITLAGDLNKAASDLSGSSVSGEWEISLYEMISKGNGAQANNPWLMEMPDPVSKVVWDNYVTMAPQQMIAKGYNVIHEKEEPFNVVELTVNGVTVTAPVFPQPGQPEGTLGLALGFGRTAAGKTADNIGSNAFSLIGMKGNSFDYSASKVSIKDTDQKYQLASTQTHHTMMGRDIVKETNLAAYKKDPKAGNKKVTISVSDGHEHKNIAPEKADLWATDKHPGFEKPGLFWNMAIDLNSCIGCGNCLISCQAENNVAVVGKEQVNMSRDMHWIRIDRYYSSETTKTNIAEGTGKIDMYQMMEIPSENPKVIFQPVMCQHCNHAPCETVCPVIATTHSNEGLNQMTYNRCVGTKYCANNCPYKVRRFNWFKYFDNNDYDYNMNNDLGKMVLNPDVTVRSRGVMEKCSLCIQRIQEGKLNAKKDGRSIVDGEIETACSQSCPTHAITFGNVNDASSRVATAVKDERSYHVLEELAIQPSVYYMVKVRNTDEKTEA